MDLSFPFQVDGSGRTASTDLHHHIRQLIEQVLFTAPGERVNRPDFGTGLNQFVFAGASDETLTAAQFLVQGSLQQWLGDLIEVEGVDVSSEDATLSVTVRYQMLQNRQRARAEFRA